ncbi:translation initiation factor IF-2-like [Salvia splendens]|uniref:translation initiation factor IF-2-like n=1 Tax=Salvia splendens TaxID=180675 RepID=UPI001C257CDD|nr:translation initiation factor IF-2-like [Salvia splendens]
MARSNKYTSLNFNGIFEKKLSNNNHQSTTNTPSSAKSFSNQSKTVLSNSRIHGHMLVLTKPTPKPISIPQKSEIKEQISSPSLPSNPIKADSISLRPQGRIGSAPVLSSSPLPSPVSPLPSKFVPPHLRPGFVGKEEKPGPDLVKGGFKAKPDFRGQRPGQGQDPGNYRSAAIEGRPKSGGGYDPVRRGREFSDPNRPSSSGNRPNSSG